MIFVRHPKPDIDPGLCYGRLDIDIHADGHGQIENALKTVKKAGQIIASPAKRCRKLALSLGARDGMEPIFDERLWEMDMGEFEGRPWSDIPQEQTREWLKDPYNIPCPGGESFREVQMRVLDAIADHDENTIVVCHAGPIRAVQMAWLGATFKEAFAQAPPFAEPVRIWPD